MVFHAIMYTNMLSRITSTQNHVFTSSFFILDVSCFRLMLIHRSCLGPFQTLLLVDRILSYAVTYDLKTYPEVIVINIVQQN
jgi:hypothetical protein